MVSHWPSKHEQVWLLRAIQLPKNAKEIFVLRPKSAGRTGVGVVSENKYTHSVKCK